MLKAKFQWKLFDGDINKNHQSNMIYHHDYNYFQLQMTRKKMLQHYLICQLRIFFLSEPFWNRPIYSNQSI